MKKTILIIGVLLVGLTASGYYSTKTTPSNIGDRLEDALVYCNMAEKYHSNYKYNEAVTAYKKAILNNPEFKKDQIQFNLGWIYAELGKYRESIQAYKKAIQFSSSNPVAHLNLGIIYLHLKQKGQAMEEYKILKTLDNEKAQTFFTMASFKETS